jgi:metal-sulfur cluster biosynthetic enzyme
MSVIERRHALAALDAVHDPELDEPITALGFVGSCEVSGAGDVAVHLRLPTSQCAPNFAYLMVADARTALRRLPGVGDVTVVLDEHYTGAEINAAVGRDAGFAGAFPDSGGHDDLEALRALFQRKALLARQGRVCQALIDGGADADAIVGLRLVDLPAGREIARCVQLRRELGLAHGPSSPALVAGDGAALAAADLTTWLRRARLVGLSLESNGALCRSLLRVRYGVADPSEPEVAAA